MKNIAQQVKSTIESKCGSTFSIYAGYGMHDGQYVRFPTGAQEVEKRNDSGRTILARYRYADNSVLEYRYNTTHKSYSLTAKQ